MSSRLSFGFWKASEHDCLASWSSPISLVGALGSRVLWLAAKHPDAGEVVKPMRVQLLETRIELVCFRRLSQSVLRLREQSPSLSFPTSRRSPRPACMPCLLGLVMC